MEIPHDEDADLGILNNKAIAVIGYGMQGSAQVFCVRDSGLSFVIGTFPANPSVPMTRADLKSGPPTIRTSSTFCCQMSCTA